MRTLRSSSPFELFDRLEQQLNQQIHSAERVPAAEVQDSGEAYAVWLELPGVDRSAITVQATDRTLVVSAERRQREPGAGEPAETLLLSEFRYGNWSRSFRFPQAIDRDRLQASYRDGLLSVTAPKANTLTNVTVQVEG